MKGAERSTSLPAEEREKKNEERRVGRRNLKGFSVLLWGPSTHGCSHIPGGGSPAQPVPGGMRGREGGRKELGVMESNPTGAGIN